ncbi:unnamed protein product [Caenorhabditis bovis]|uniref:G-protein coupled receptors family 1 profile domain-containing protein n=1 Tax=Caenorhabditis bovis TaxID=2654633 RepID=A0A8S1EET4_9PELO|nr:unnamed protein product [Caenorhabditis bovis]
MDDVQVHDVDRIAAILIFLTSFIGFSCNTFIAIYIKRLSLLRNSFGRLLQLQAIGDAIFVLVWAFYFAPVLFFDIKALQILPIASHLAQLCLICYDISIYTHLIISFNRFISLYFPTSYQAIFTDRFTSILVFAIVFVSFSFSWFLIAVDCRMGFSIPRWMLDYVSPPCEMINVYYAEFFRGLILISMFAFINTCTFVRMHFHNRKKQASSQFETTQQKKRRAVETAFVQQVTLQGLLYVIELVTYFYIANSFPVPLEPEALSESPNRWPNFLLTTYAWILVHSLDGVITLIFNRQFRTVFTRPWRSANTLNISKTPSRRSRYMTTRDESRKKSSILACTFISNSNTQLGSSAHVLTRHRQDSREFLKAARLVLDQRQDKKLETLALSCIEQLCLGLYCLVLDSAGRLKVL